MVDALAATDSMELTETKKKLAAAEARAEKADRDLNRLLEDEEKVPFDPFKVAKEE